MTVEANQAMKNKSRRVDKRAETVSYSKVRLARQEWKQTSLMGQNDQNGQAQFNDILIKKY